VLSGPTSTRSFGCVSHSGTPPFFLFVDACPVQCVCQAAFSRHLPWLVSWSHTNRTQSNMQFTLVAAQLALVWWKHAHQRSYDLVRFHISCSVSGVVPQVPREQQRACRKYRLHVGVAYWAVDDSRMCFVPLRCVAFPSGTLSFLSESPLD